MRLADQSAVAAAMNFIDILVISDFGDFYFAVTSDEKLSILLSKGSLDLGKGAPLTLKALMEIETTTSQEARRSSEANRL